MRIQPSRRASHPPARVNPHFVFSTAIATFAAGPSGCESFQNSSHMTAEHKHPKHFAIDMKMSELPDCDPRLLGVIRRLGIRFGFGEKTVEEVCNESGVNPHTLLLICKVYVYDGYRPTKAELSGSSIADIITYLHNSHDYYIHLATKTLSEAISEMTVPCDAGRSKILIKFYESYREELQGHFDYEEKTVFPYVKELARSGRPSGDYCIDRYEKNHSNVEEKLCDLKNIVMKYLPEQCDDELILKVLNYLYSLEDDLVKHTGIENDILIPMVNAEESRSAAGRQDEPNRCGK